MKYNLEKHHRRSIRLKGYDYSQPGAYFITICTRDRKPILSNIIDGEIRLSEISKIVKDEWYNIKNRFPNVETDEFVIMPNHIHGIIIVGATLVVAHNNKNVGTILVVAQHRAGTSPAPTVTIGHIVGTFKSLCVYKGIQKGNNLPRLWQRNYYEHIIREENEFK